MCLELEQGTDLKPGPGVWHVNFKNLGLDSADLLKQIGNSSITSGKKNLNCLKSRPKKQKGKSNVKLWRLLQITLGYISDVFEMKVLAKVLRICLNPKKYGNLKFTCHVWTHFCN